MKSLIITTAVTVVLSGGTVATSSAAKASAVHHRPAVTHHLPGWVHWRYAPGYWRDIEDCKLHGKALSKRPIVIWTGKGDSSVLACPPPPYGNGAYLPS